MPTFLVGEFSLCVPPLTACGQTGRRHWKRLRGFEPASPRYNFSPFVEQARFLLQAAHHGYFRVFTLPVLHVAFEICSVEETELGCSAVLPACCGSIRKNIMFHPHVPLLPLYVSATGPCVMMKLPSMANMLLLAYPALQIPQD